MLGSSLASGAYGAGKSREDPSMTETITLRAKFHGGLWKKSLYIKLVKLRLTDFTLCAIWTRPAGETFDCELASKRQLPEGTIMRLEQSPVAKAVKRPESPGWGMLGASPD